MEPLHPLLRRQIKRCLGAENPLPANLEAFLKAVSDSYTEFDTDRKLLDRAIELSAQEVWQANSELRGILHALPDLLVRITAQNRIVKLTQAGVESLPLPLSSGESGDSKAVSESGPNSGPDSFSHSGPVAESRHPDATSRFWQVVRQVRTTQEIAAYEYSTLLDGQERFCEMRLLPFVDGDLIGIVRDITSQRIAEMGLLQVAALQEARSRVLEQINSRMPLNDVLKMVIGLVTQQYSQVDCCLHLLEPDGTMKMVAFCCASARVGDCPKRAPVSAEGAICSRAAYHRQMIFDRLPHTACSCPVLSSSGEFLGTISGCGFEVRQLDTCKELLELGSQLAALAIDNRRLIDNLEHRTRHDVLTGLPNRVQLDRRLTAALDAARETGEFVAVLYIDLDGFKRINDEFGHRIGDIFLRRTAERFRSSLRENDLLARVGGDEFVSISMGMRQPEDGLELVQRLLASLERPLNLAEGLALGCSASIGVAIYPRDGQTVEELERHADEAMYAAKAAGKGQFRSFDQRRNDSF